uniref:Uncharacterized protein n=1 Tax=Vibrio tasmaniensis TaxID=212663 RepID=A0A0H3ZQM4_9VIBR|nr:hypothetical protein [Vibrio tasmaniensis]
MPLRSTQNLFTECFFPSLKKSKKAEHTKYDVWHLKSGVHYSYYVKSTSLLSETALRTPQTLLAKILDT